MVEDIKASNKQLSMLKWLAYYRLLTPKQLAQIIFYTEEITTSNSKYTYNQLQKLEDEGLVKRFKPHPKISKYSVYYLSNKGLDFIQAELEIWEGIHGKGWIYKDQSINFGHFKYDTYKPPLKQLNHHLFTVDMLITCYLQNVGHRNNLYASRLSKEKELLRPDAEATINNKNYLIEIDNGTEMHHQLIEKFKKYFSYLGSTKDHQDIHYIVFIIDSKHSEQLTRRWNSILAAYYIAMRGLYDRIELILITKNEFSSFLYLETNRNNLIFLVADHLEEKLELENRRLHKIDNYFRIKDDNKTFNYQIATAKYTSSFVDINPQVALIGYFSEKEPELKANLTGYPNIPEEILKKYEAISPNFFTKKFSLI